ncbi:MAG: tetratricopeptide repeat protein [Euryarchaeota archaeon]|nr:tetratricopeptide repeat protein [Euryarchaeota archaeon]
MNKYREQLEGTGRLFRIRRIRHILMIVLTGLVIGLSAYALALKGARIKPFFFPLDAFLPLLLIFVFIATLMNFVFRTLEMRYARRDSQRFLIARNAISRATIVAAVCLLMGAILIVPVTGHVLDTGLSGRWAGTIGPGGSFAANFTNEDALGVVRATGGIVRVDSTQRVYLTIVWTDLEGIEGGRETGPVAGASPYSFAIIQDEHLRYTVTIENPSNQAIRVQLSVARTLMPELTTVVPAILLAVGLSHIVWFLYLRPVRDRYEASSIYSIRYEERVDLGERTFADYQRGSHVARESPVPANPAPVRGSTVVVPALAHAPPPPPAPPEELPQPEAIVAEQEDASTLIEEGSRLFAEGQFDAALARFDEALERDASNVAALLAGAATLMRMDRRTEALGAYERVLEVDPHNANALLGRGEVLEAEGRWREAADAWAAYLEEVPLDVTTRLRRAEALAKAGDRGAAVRVLQGATSLAPDDLRIRRRIDELQVDVPLFLSRALVASASGQLEEALSLFDRILAVEPDNVNALVGKGVALRRVGREDEALVTLDAALARQPNNTAALRAKGQILEGRDAHEEALVSYEALVEASPRDAEVWALRAGVLEEVGQIEQALASYREALKLDPENETWRARAEALEASRKGEESLLEELFTIKGVGQARVRALLAAGYRSVDAVRAASEEELVNVRGLSRKVAQDIYRHFHPDASA